MADFPRFPALAVFLPDFGHILGSPMVNTHKTLWEIVCGTIPSSKKLTQISRRDKMVIGVMVSGIIAGLVATIGSFSVGFPLWAALILYPVMGTLGAVAFIAFALSREKAKQNQALPEFSPEYR